MGSLALLVQTVHLLMTVLSVVPRLVTVRVLLLMVRLQLRLSTLEVVSSRVSVMLPRVVRTLKFRCMTLCVCLMTVVGMCRLICPVSLLVYSLFPADLMQCVPTRLSLLCMVRPSLLSALRFLMPLVI